MPTRTLSTFPARFSLEVRTLVPGFLEMVLSPVPGLRTRDDELTSLIARSGKQESGDDDAKYLSSARELKRAMIEYMKVDCVEPRGRNTVRSGA